MRTKPFTPLPRLPVQPVCSAAVPLLVLAGVSLLCACNAFDSNLTSASPNSVVPPSDSADGPTMFPTSPSVNAPPGSVGVPGCTQCGSFCADCGRGCECKAGHTPFDPPPWNVPFSEAGQDGWKDSDRALCAGMDSVISTRLWAGADGVYVLMGGMARALTDVGGFVDDDAGTAVQGVPEFAAGVRTRVLHNGGAGWALRAEVAGTSMEGGITGLPGSSLILYGGRGAHEGACPLGVVAGRAFACQPTATAVKSVYAVNDHLAFALTAAGELLAFDGEAWHQSSLTPAPASAVWADENEVVAVGPDGNVMRMREGAWTTESVGQLARLTAVWGTSGDNLWVGAFNAALFHYDGTSWQPVAQLGGVTCSTQPPIEHIWGAGTHIWMSTVSQLARWDGGKLESFGNWTCSSLGGNDRITDLWGTSESDVFVAVTGDTVTGPCGGAFVVHYDGQTFHRI